MTLTECNLSDRKNKVHLTALVIFVKMLSPLLQFWAEPVNINKINKKTDTRIFFYPQSLCSVLLTVFGVLCLEVLSQMNKNKVPLDGWLIA